MVSRSNSLETVRDIAAFPRRPQLLLRGGGSVLVGSIGEGVGMVMKRSECVSALLFPFALFGGLGI